LVAIESLKRKYGRELAGILDLREEISRSLESLVALRISEGELVRDFGEKTIRYQTSAESLSQCRVLSAASLESLIIRELREVALPNAQFSVLLTRLGSEDSGRDSTEEPSGDDSDGTIRFGPLGYDRVEFFISANPGESPRPLAKVASGGELSRLLLVLRTLEGRDAETDATAATMVFDEIDEGIGGAVAEAVGRRLKRLAKSRQVLCVTHQAQIARFAEHHYSVRKSVVKGRTITKVSSLSESERIQEITRLIDGSAKMESTAVTAKWMIENSEV
jgi:DNA repair protein RecN (Recombination protein N)